MFARKTVSVSIALMIVFVIAFPGIVLAAPPGNDNFANATIIETTPYAEYVNLFDATLENGEPIPPCGDVYTTSQTIWFKYTSTSDSLLFLKTQNYYDTFVAIYRGETLDNLEYIDCGSYYQGVAVQAYEGETYNIQIGNRYYINPSTLFELTLDPPVNVDIYPPFSIPSTFDLVNFYADISDPANMDYDCLWNFGDGNEYYDCYGPSHQYLEDGQYVVSLEVTTEDGRSGSDSIILNVETHDVSVVRFSTPRSAYVGQTRQFTVGVSNIRYPETVTIRLYKSIPGPYNYETQIGFLTQSVPIRPINRTTAFTFNYTFTEEDLEIGKVTFRVYAYIEDNSDAYPGDNELISRPTKVLP